MPPPQVVVVVWQKLCDVVDEVVLVVKGGFVDEEDLVELEVGEVFELDVDDLVELDVGDLVELVEDLELEAVREVVWVEVVGGGALDEMVVELVLDDELLFELVEPVLKEELCVEVDEVVFMDEVKLDDVRDVVAVVEDLVLEWLKLLERLELLAGFVELDDELDEVDGSLDDTELETDLLELPVLIVEE